MSLEHLSNQFSLFNIINLEHGQRDNHLAAAAFCAASSCAAAAAAASSALATASASA